MASTSPIEVLIKDGTPIILADTTDYTSAGGDRTDQIDLTSLGAATARQSDGISFTTPRSDVMSMFVGCEFTGTVVSGGTVDYYIGFSPTTSVRPGGLTGLDSSYAGTAGDSLDDTLKQLDYIGSLVVTSDSSGTPQYGQVGVFRPVEINGAVVVDNNTTVAFIDDAAETFVRISTLPTEVQT